MKGTFNRFTRFPVSETDALGLSQLREKNVRLTVRIRALEEFEKQVRVSFFWRFTHGMDRGAERLFPPGSERRRFYNFLILLVRSVTLDHRARQRLNVPPWKVLAASLLRRHSGHISEDRTPRWRAHPRDHESWLEAQQSVLARKLGGVRDHGMVRVIHLTPTDGAQKWEGRIGARAITHRRVRPQEDISDILNETVRRTTEPWLTFLENGDALSPFTGPILEQTVARHPGVQLIYWDHDYTEGDERGNAFFKPAWSTSLLLSLNYIGNAFALSRELFKEIGGSHAPSLYDMLLRAMEANPRVVHVPRLLSSIDLDNSRTMELDDRQSLPAALARRQRDESVESFRGNAATIRRPLRQEPLVSVIIPTRDEAALLEDCLQSLTTKTRYQNYENIVIDNDSCEPETAALFRRWAERIHVMRFRGKFNFSALCNRGSLAAKGTVLLFLNNDIEVIEPQWLDCMVEQAIEPDVGAVGARLLFPDGRIQHAGIVVGLSGLADNAFRGFPGTGTVYHDLENSVRECSAVTAACLAIRTEAFKEIGGFNEELKVCFNDVDLGLRLLAKGYRNLYVASASLVHHESHSRPRVSPPADMLEAFRIWASFIHRGDPFYNPNLDLFATSFVRSPDVPREL